MKKRAIDRALEAAGGNVSELARRVGVSRQTVHRWLNGADIDPDNLEAVEAATGVSRHDLRPDLSRIFSK